MGTLLAEAARLQDADAPQAVIDKAQNGPLRAPLVVVVIARLQEHFKVPKSEQLLAAACAAHGILLAAYAQGIGAVWRTGELSYSAHVAKGLGLTAGANIGTDAAIFEAVHGSAPDIADKGIANPTAMILAGAMMLEHLGETAAARKIEQAVRDVIREGQTVTPDLKPGSPHGTRDIAEAIIARVKG